MLGLIISTMLKTQME